MTTSTSHFIRLTSQLKGLTLSVSGVPGVEDHEWKAPHNCCYSGGSTDSWAVVCTCDGLAGLIEHDGKSFQVEEVEEEVEEEEEEEVKEEKKEEERVKQNQKKEELVKKWQKEGMVKEKVQKEDEMVNERQNEELREEQLQTEAQQQQQQEGNSTAVDRRRRAVLSASPLVVVFALTSHLGPEPALPPVVPDVPPWFPDSRTSPEDPLAPPEDPLAPPEDPIVPPEDPSSTITTRSVRRSRRRVTSDGPYTVELAVFMDQKLYTYIKNRYPNHNQDERALQIVMTLVNAVSRLYNDASLGKVRLKMLVKKVEVLGNGKVSQGKGDIYKYLKNFCMYQVLNNPGGRTGWDHALMLSGRDLWNKDPSKNSTVGLAYVGGMCSPAYSCTVNEATSFSAAYIIAHELGHNLNMVHDGQGEAFSCASDKFIMAPVMASGATTWSSCSKRSLSRFLQVKGECLTVDKTNSATPGVGTHEGPAPGQRFDADAQCHYMYGSGWNHFSNSQAPFNNVCREIWCRKETPAKNTTLLSLGRNNRVAMARRAVLASAGKTHPSTATSTSRREGLSKLKRVAGYHHHHHHHHLGTPPPPGTTLKPPHRPPPPATTSPPSLVTYLDEIQ
ncbi:hypothetical protein Pcinc_043182 [Petrolisthes cinctipes]|uniref:Peptidase M12B domain-containing protein n=1 Tax=Petrolisthes cinctipes TaxID=88211 RepID=A0AAE1EF97_PETCI|nr:hypothetical protein Pcinc_043182 [Petrolisthes cinctipes]